MKAGYVSKGKAKTHNRIVTICVILAIVALWCAFTSHTPNAAHVENVETKEYTKTYTVEKWNGKVEAVYIDLMVYDIDAITRYNPDDNSESIDSCDRYDDENEEGQKCVLTDNIRMWMFLNSVGY